MHFPQAALGSVWLANLCTLLAQLLLGSGPWVGSLLEIPGPREEASVPILDLCPLTPTPMPPSTKNSVQTLNLGEITKLRALV